MLDHRSSRPELIAIPETGLSNPDISAVTATREFLKLSWDDSRTADEIIDSIMKDRNNSGYGIDV
jgi:hypothetical protein